MGEKLTKVRSISALISPMRKRNNQQDGRSLFTQAETNEMPGPGSYSGQASKFGSGVPTFTISSTNRDKSKSMKADDKNGGPGQYDVDKSTQHIKPRIQSALISKTRRPDVNGVKKDAAEGAGPGDYTEPRVFGKDTKSFKIGEKRPQKIRKSVGPGEYEVEKAINIVRNSSQTFKIAKNARPSTLVSKEK